MKIFSTISMFCCVLKSSDCHIIYSTYIPRKYLVWEVWEAFNFPCRLWRWDSMARGEMIGQKNTGLLLQWISQESLHSFLNWLKIRKNPGIFVQLWGGRKRNFLVSKGGYINTLWLSAKWLRFGQSTNQSSPPQNPAGLKSNQSFFDDCLICALSKPAFL